MDQQEKGRLIANDDQLATVYKGTNLTEIAQPLPSLIPLSKVQAIQLINEKVGPYLVHKYSFPLIILLINRKKWWKNHLVLPIRLALAQQLHWDNLRPMAQFQLSLALN